MPRRPTRLLVAAMALLLVGAGCSDDSGTGTAVGDQNDQAVDNPFSDRSSEGASSDDRVPVSDDAILEAAAEDVEAFWTVEFPEIYGDEYEPVSGGFLPYGPDTDPVPACGEPTSYKEIAQNAFYCPVGDFVAWDTENLTDQLLDEFGPFTLGLVMAHELGHAVQARAGVFERPGVTTFDAEQQADCFAGAWAKQAKENPDDTFDVSEQDLDRALAGFLVLRDSTGISNFDPNAHGSGFQRIAAFQDGYQDGTGQCDGYESGSPNTEAGDQQLSDNRRDPNQGNQPLEDLIPLLDTNLEAYWKVVGPEIDADWTEVDFQLAQDFETCEGNELDISDGALPRYCEEEDVVMLDDEVFLPEALRRFGDGAPALYVIEAYTTRAQVLAGQLAEPQIGGLQNDCLTGAYLASLAKDGVVDLPTGTDPLKLSAGDLDETITGFLFIGADTEGSEGAGPSAFRRVNAMREGFLTALEKGAVSSSKSCLQAFEANGDPTADSDGSDAESESASDG